MEITKTVETGAGPVVVKKLALYDYSEFFRALKKLPAEIGKFGDMDKSKVLEVFPELIAESFGDFVGILAVVTDKDEKFFESREFDLADALEIVDVALELNDYAKIVNSVKKIMARGKASKASQERKK